MADASADASASGAGSPTAAQLNLQLKEVTAMMQERTEELTTLRASHAALKASNEEATARIASLESSLAAAQGGAANGDANAALTASLKAKDDEIALLKSRSNELIHKVDRLESEVLSARKLGESAAAKVEQEKDEEIIALKQMFTEVSEKRKESFLQLKEKLKTASEMLSKNQAQYQADQQALAALRAQLESSAAALKEKSAQVGDYEKRVHDLEHEKGDLFQRTADELQSEKSKARESVAKVESLQRELAAANAAARMLEEKESRQEETDMSLEPEGGVLENGRPVRILVGGELPSRDTPIQWSRSFRGSAFLPLAGRSLPTAGTYTPTVDDIGSVLRAEILVGSHGENNIPVYREIGPVGAKRAMVAAVHDVLRKKDDITLHVEHAFQDGGGAGGAGGKKEKPSILLTKEKIKLREGGKTVAKANWSEGLRVSLTPDSLTRFTLFVESSASPVAYAAGSGGERDAMVQTIRCFAQVHLALANKNPLPQDSTLALAYLIRAGNEQRAAAALKLLSTKSGAPPRLRQASEDGFGFGAATGDSPTAIAAAARARQASNAAALADTPRSSVNRKPGGGGSGAEVSASASASAAASGPPVAVATIKGSNGEDLEVDADGFVIRRETGWGSTAAAAASSPAAAAASSGAGAAAAAKKDAGGDSDFSADEDESAEVMKINSEARPIASAAELRRHSMVAAPPGATGIKGIGGVLPPPGAAGGIDAGKAERKKAKAEKKEKKEKKRRERGQSVMGEDGNPAGREDSDNVMSPNNGNDAEPSPSSSQQNQQTAPTPLSVNASASTNALSPQGGASGGQSVSQAGHFASSSQAPNSQANDDLFAFFDQEAAKAAPPALGASPKAVAAAPAASSTPSKPAPASASSTPAKPPASSPRPPASGPAPSPRSQQISSPRSPLRNSVDILVMETLHARVVDGSIVEFAIWGDILLNLAMPIPFKDARFDFQLFNTDKISKFTPTADLLTPGKTPGLWEATLPAGTEGPVVVMKYKVNVGSDLREAKRQVPLQLSVRWDTSKTNTAIDVHYRMTPSPLVKTNLTDIKFVLSLAPEKCIKQCVLAQPKCMWSPASQKMMWQLASLPAAESGSTSGTLHAELTNDGVACEPQPVALNFMSEDLEGVVSGLLVTEAEGIRAGAAAADPVPLGRLIYRIKSGTYTVA